MMASLKRYLDPRIREEADLHEICCGLLSRIATTPVVASEREKAVFQADLHQLADILRESSVPEELARTAEAAGRVLEEYNHDVNVYVRKQRLRLREALRMTAETIAEMSGENTWPAERLREIGDQLQKENALEEISHFKREIGRCLQGFQQEVARQKKELEDLILALRRDIERGPQQAEAPAPADIDPATDLPQRHACVEGLRASIEAGKRRFVVVFVVSRLRAINLRFGRDGGDRILRRFGEFVQQQLLPTDRMYRWNGPTLVAVLDRSETLDQIRNQAHRILEPKLEETLEVEGRVVMIRVSAAWSAFQLLTTAESAERHIDTFAASQHTEEYV